MALAGMRERSTRVSGNKLFVEVWGYSYRCGRCTIPFTWVFGLRPSHRPREDDLVTCDQPQAVDVARTILTEVELFDLAAQLRPRPQGARGASFNPNMCPGCQHQADWYTLEDLIVRALHDGWEVLARSPIPIPQWRALKDERHAVYAF